MTHAHHIDELRRWPESSTALRKATARSGFPALLDCLDTGARPRGTAEDGLATLGVLLRLYEHCQKEAMP